MSSLHVTVIGATGFTGRHIVIELLKRGHVVSGVCRNPEKIGRHERYHPIALNVLCTSVTELATIFARADVIIKYVYGYICVYSLLLTLIVHTVYP